MRTGLQRQQNALRRQQQAALQQQTALQQQLALQQQSALQNLMQQQLANQNFTQSQTDFQQPTSMQAVRDRRQQLRRAAYRPPAADVAPIGSGPSPAPQDPEQIASRQLSVARMLAEDADAADREGKSDMADALRTRVEERLQRLVSRYAGTEAATSAEKMLRRLR